MAALSDRRRTLSPEHVNAQPIMTNSVDNNHRTLHQRVAGKNGLRHRPARQESLRRNIEHVAAETYLITRLAFTLLRYLGIGYRWITQLLALGCYAMLLMPGFLQVAYCYFFSSKVKRSIVYGDQPRNRLDLYLPANIGESKPVLIFVTGGAWIIGYKAWGSLLGLQLAERGIIVACIDYRYNLLDLVDHFHNRGLYRSIFLSIMEGEQSLKKFSPEIKIQDPCLKGSIPHFPPVYLVHGTADYSIPSVSSEQFAEALKRAGVRAEIILYQGKTHTDLFLQDPLRGGKDELFDLVVAVIHSNDNDALAKNAIAPPRRRFVPEILLKLATKISPF